MTARFEEAICTSRPEGSAREFPGNEACRPGGFKNRNKLQPSPVALALASMTFPLPSLSHANFSLSSAFHAKIRGMNSGVRYLVRIPRALLPRYARFSSVHTNWESVTVPEASKRKGMSMVQSLAAAETAELSQGMMHR